VAYGIASLVAEASEKLYALKRLVEKYSPDFEKESEDVSKRSLNTTCIIRIDIQHISCKGHIEV
ncbi:MAG TPA: pyridoxamine 5'-phosphate oxidase family protein, partial [Mesotoga sp.]|nr:pyridoxamine 5'-phosphate oxidase family protein [Mesotoga sp.]